MHDCDKLYLYVANSTSFVLESCWFFISFSVAVLSWIECIGMSGWKGVGGWEGMRLVQTGRKPKES